MIFKNLSFVILFLVLISSFAIAFECRGLHSEAIIDDEECSKKEIYNLDLKTCRNISPNNENDDGNDFETPEFPDYSDNEGSQYTKAKYDSGCCTSAGSFHRRCTCNKIEQVNSCRSICNNDSKCKGYAIYQNKECQIATTSSCPADCRGPYNDANTQKLDDNSRCFLGGWNGGCEIKARLNQIRTNENNNVNWKYNFKNDGDHGIHTTQNLLKRGKDNGTLSLLMISNNKKINQGAPSKRKQKQHSNNQEANQERFNLRTGNKVERTSVNKEQNNKSNQRPPSSIKLRGKLNVEGHRCKKMELLRKIKASMETVEGYKNQSMFLICQELKVEKSIALKRSSAKSFDICFCKENNKKCMNKASMLRYDTIENELAKFDENSEENSGNHGYTNTANILFILIFSSMIFMF